MSSRSGEVIHSNHRAGIDFEGGLLFLNTEYIKIHFAMSSRGCIF